MFLGNWWYDPACERLFTKQGDQTYFYRRAPGRVSRAAVQRFHDKEEGFIPLTARLATVEFQRSYVVLTGYGEVVSSEDAIPTNQSFAEFCKSFIHEDARWAVPTQHKKDVQQIAEAIINGTAIAVSDGSFGKAHGTAAWIIQGVSGLGEVGVSSSYLGIPLTKARIDPNWQDCTQL